MNDNLLEEYRELSTRLRDLTKIEKLARRFPVQIDYIDQAIEETKEIDGVILELGLGGGRTLEYLEKKSSSPIVVFEKSINSDLKLERQSTQLVEGDFLETIPEILKSQQLTVRMVHADIGTRDYLNDINRFEPLREIFEDIVPSGGIVVCDRPLNFSSFKLLANAHKSGWPYYLWKKV